MCDIWLYSGPRYTRHILLASSHRGRVPKHETRYDKLNALTQGVLKATSVIPGLTNKM